MRIVLLFAQSGTEPALGIAQDGLTGAEESCRQEVVRIVVELRDGDPVSELSQTVETATSGAGVEGVV